MDKKTEILDATFSQFCRRGYSVVMSDIAKDVGIKTPSIYSHFSSKDEIILLVVERQIEEYCGFLDTLYANIQQLDWIHKLEKIYFDIIRYFKNADQVRFYKNILLIDQADLRKKCSAKVFDMELFHLSKLESVFPNESEGNALLFLSIIQGALEVELLFYESDDTAEAYITKIWRSYREKLGE